MIKQPMLAAKFDSKDKVLAAKQMGQIKFPIWGSVKIDGIRAHNYGGGLFSRKNKLIPNAYTQALFADLKFADGELAIGQPNAPGLFNRTQSGVMSRDGEPDVRYYIFDHTRDMSLSFWERFNDLGNWEFLSENVIIVTQVTLENLEQVFAFEEESVLSGWEGIMLRAPNGPYKQGRSTLNEGWLIKMKRYEDSEAIILGCYEQETNLNEAIINEVGKSKRSSHKENRFANGHLGGFHVRDLVTGVEFDIGNFLGITQEERRLMWSRHKLYPQHFIGQIAKYKYFPVGVKDKPRHPTFLGFRNPIDL